MSKIEKLLLRFLGNPKDFTWKEVLKLMSNFGFDWYCSGGSHGFFVSQKGEKIQPATRPHGNDGTIPTYQLRQYKQKLIAFGYIDPEEE